jgi:hypothetical protein
LIVLCDAQNPDFKVTHLISMSRSGSEEDDAGTYEGHTGSDLDIGDVCEDLCSTLDDDDYEPFFEDDYPVRASACLRYRDATTPIDAWHLEPRGSPITYDASTKPKWYTIAGQ